MNSFKKLSLATVLVSTMLLTTGCPSKPQNQPGVGGGMVGVQPGYQPGVIQPLPNGQFQVTFSGQNNYDAVDGWGNGELAGGSAPVVGGLTIGPSGMTHACTFGYCWDFINPIRPTGTTTLGGTVLPPPSGTGTISRTVQGYSKMDQASTVSLQGISSTVTTINNFSFRPMNVVGQITLSPTQLQPFNGQMPSVTSVAYNFRFYNGQLQGGGILIYINPTNGKNGIFLLF